MKLALRGKSKLGFVDGSCAKSMYRGSTVANELILIIMFASSAKKVWNDFKRRFDRCSLTRIYYLWSKIASMRQGTDSVTTYYLKMNDLWSELDILAPKQGCDYEESRPSLEHLSQQRLLQFLMGLNESYSNVRSNVLMKRPVVSINEAYAIVTQEESQRALGAFDVNNDPMTMMAGRPRYNKSKKIGIICEHCGYKGHLKKNCYKIVGYPTDFKSKKKTQVVGGGRTFVNNANAEDTSNSEAQPHGHYLTKEQYEQLIGLLNKPPGAKCFANIAGIVSLMSDATEHDWIVDTGATHHITCNKDLLDTLKIIDGYRSVQLPTGKTSNITHTGNAKILGNQKVNNVLYVPNFKLYFLSVSKLTKDLSYLVAFFPDFCVLQRIYSGKVLGIGREHERLYIIKSREAENKALVAGTITKKNAETVLRNYRMGHAQMRLQFPTSVSNSTVVFQLLHLDVWGPYKVPTCGRKHLLSSYGISHQTSCPYTPQQNGIVEIKHRHILEVARALKFQSGVPIRFWGNCVKTVVYVINRLPTTVLKGRTPYELLYGKELKIDHSRVFGYQCHFTTLPKGDKVAPKSRKTVFIGYSETPKGYRLYDLE
uniref:Uncharacterized protein n=2 Tax=Nicotiana TaxID=4085 RepID=A0A1S3Y5E4_TOBAC|nr:PREDICTED: uncharacterized protein LOC104210447 [Nicotiana sylvestris]XP_016447391.1 PREDICTED: uncharacterized protein LOC107772404 [Nicotiana tabacum]